VLEPDERLQHALKLAFSYLNRRDRTEAEVRHRLTQHGAEDAAIEDAIAALTDQGYLDDARFARLLAQDKRELEQWGSERIRRTLLQRGIDRELVEQTLASRQTESELAQALGLLHRRFRSPPRERRERDRALGVLIRKGYDGEMALDALAAFIGEGSASAGD
jgi:regulatory protein